MREKPKSKAQRDLEALRERVASIASTLPDVVWSVALPSLKVLYVSPAAESVYGRTAEQMTQKFSEWSNSLHPDDRAALMERWERAVGGVSFDAEHRIVTPKGEVRWIHSRGRCARDANGTVVRIDGMDRDITERREQERRIAQLNRVHAVLREINAVTVNIRDRGALLREACRVAVDQGGFGQVWIGLVDKAYRQLKVVTHHGFGDGFPGEPAYSLDDDRPDSPWHESIQVLRNRTPYVNNDIAAAPHGNPVRKHAVERGCRSLIILPLTCGGESAGQMVLYAKEAGFFNADEIRLLSDLGADISLALENIANEEKLKYLAHYDELTGLPNRELFLEHLQKSLSAPSRDPKTTTVAVGNIRRLRMVNESFGRSTGNALLREFAQRIRAQWPEPEQLARISGDSFALILPGGGDAVGIATTIENAVARAVDAPFVVDGKEFRISMAVGAAVCPPDVDEPEVLLQNAEAALKKAKTSGERVLFYQPEMNARVAETLLLENKLRRAIDQQQFILHYQPKVATTTGQVTGLEALIRWRDPEQGLVAPSKFVPILEETGMILDVGPWAIRKALAESRDWRLTYFGPLRIAVNVSPIQLGQRDFVDTVKRALDGLGIAATQLDLEITESMIMQDVEVNVKKLAAIRQMGVNIAVDDFGTGYSSLAYLTKLPVTALKIDRSFVASMTSNAQSMTLVSTIISLAHALDLKVIAEGVESQEQAKLLRLLKCDEMQGFLFSKPLPSQEIQAFLCRGEDSKT
jgi:diguanylate cyclase (GGDEF)-like protein/PAS domain S-box-containing protein